MPNGILLLLGLGLIFVVYPIVVILNADEDSFYRTPLFMILSCVGFGPIVGYFYLIGDHGNKKPAVIVMVLGCLIFGMSFVFQD